MLVVILLWTFGFVFFASCNSVEEKEHLRTDKISNKLYIEHYILRKGGVLMGNTYACYITDSNKFYKKIGVYDDDEIVNYSARGTFVVICIKPSRCYGIEDTFRERHYKFKINYFR